MRKLLSVFLAAILLVGCSAPKETASYRQISIEDELFWNAVRDSYKSIDLSGRNKRDMERFLSKHKKTADWLRKQANGIYF